MLNVHPKHVYRLLHRGLPAHRLGGEWRYDPVEVRAWLATRSSEPTEEPPPHDAAPPLLAANGDLCVEALLRSVLEATGQAIGLVAADRTSGRRLLESSRVLAAGVHGTEPSGGDGLVRLHVTRRQLGLAYPKGARVRSLAGVTGLRLASRATSAGIRGHFDVALLEAGLDAERVHRRAQLHASHRDVALAVLSGKADAGIVTVAWAERAGLGCLPFAEEDYDLCLRPAELSKPGGRDLVRALQGRELRRSLQELAGYDPKDAGELRV